MSTLSMPAAELSDGLDLRVEELEELESPAFNWDHFLAGVGIGIALVALT